MQEHHTAKPKAVFNGLVRDHCRRQAISLRELARRAGISAGNVLNWATGTKPIGEVSARRLGVALQLDGDQMQEFIRAALRTSSEPPRVWIAFGKKVETALAAALTPQGRQLVFVSTPADRKGADADLIMRDGTSVGASFEIHTVSPLELHNLADIARSHSSNPKGSVTLLVQCNLHRPAVKRQGTPR